MVSVLEDAIRSRRVVTFHYDGLPRIVEPFLIGTTTAGRPALRGFQTGGGSQSGRVPGWHLFSLDKIVGITMTPTTFSGVRDGYNPSSVEPTVARTCLIGRFIVYRAVTVVLNH